MAAEFYQKGFIKDLSGNVTDADRSDFSKTALETVTYQGALVALPIMVHNCAMYYRTDLFEKAGLSAPPASWDEYRAFAKKTTDTSAGVWGTLIASKQGIEASTRLHSFYQQAEVISSDPTASRPSTPRPGGQRSNSWARWCSRTRRRLKAYWNLRTCRACGWKASSPWRRSGRISTR